MKEDVPAGLESGRSEGEALELEKGRDEGTAREKRKIAENFKNSGIPIEVIAQNAELTVE